MFFVMGFLNAKIVYRGRRWLGWLRAETSEMGHASARLHCAINCCSLILVEKKNKPCKHSHPHRSNSRMEPCWTCGEKPLCHTITDKEKRCISKTQLAPKAVLWQPQNRPTT